MKKIAMMLLFLTFAAWGLVLAEQAQYGNGEDSLMLEEVDDNSAAVDNAYVNDVEYLQSEEGSEPAHEDFGNSENVSTPMNPDLNAPQNP
jgi:hypothetical protein